MFKGLFGLEISEGAIANIFSRTHAPFAAEAGRIDAEVRAAAVIASDRLGARRRPDLLAVGVWLGHCGSAPHRGQPRQSGGQ